MRVTVRLAFAFAAAGAALAIVALLEPHLGLPVLFPAFLAIVLVSAGAAGTWYGILTAALFGAGHAFLFLGHPFGTRDPRAPAILVAFLIAALLVSYVGGALRKGQALARQQHRSLRAVHEQREDLLKGLTHDVRSPLSVITMNAALLTRETADPVVLRRARAIETSAARVGRMLSDLVETVHLESGDVQVQRTPVELSSFLVELKSRLEGTLALERVRLAIPDGLPALQVDPVRFERILVNLLSNALKYAPPPSPVVLGAALREGQIVVSVADSGPGISQEDLPRIFDKYFRASATRSEVGLGIGLYASRMLVQLHGGRIWAESVVGEGTTFHVALPTAPPEGPRPASTRSQPPPQRNSSEGAVRSPPVRVPEPRAAGVPVHHPRSR